MAKIKLQNVYHPYNEYAGSAGIEHGVGVILRDTLDFKNDEYLKKGFFPIGVDGKVVKGATAGVPVFGFFDGQQIGSLSDLFYDAPASGQEIAVVHGFRAKVDVAGTAGAPVYIDDDGNFNTVAGTVEKIAGYYVDYDPMKMGDSTFAGKVVDFSMRKL